MITTDYRGGVQNSQKCDDVICERSLKERSYLIREFQNDLKHNGSPYGSHNGSQWKTLPDNYLLAKTRTGNLLKQLADDALLKNYEAIFKQYLQGNNRKS